MNDTERFNLFNKAKFFDIKSLRNVSNTQSKKIAIFVFPASVTACALVLFLNSLIRKLEMFVRKYTPKIDNFSLFVAFFFVCSTLSLMAYTLTNITIKYQNHNKITIEESAENENDSENENSNQRITEAILKSNNLPKVISLTIFCVTLISCLIVYLLTNLISKSALFISKHIPKINNVFPLISALLVSACLTLAVYKFTEYITGEENEVEQEDIPLPLYEVQEDDNSNEFLTQVTEGKETPYFTDEKKIGEK